ncbi:hypothetical protein ACEN88_01835 [Massilia sp. CT11-108]|uniref:hypothetical protein n=1 Tax=Massilia sp. CT11-108 TaxID=3393900 RepID=UPI0039A43E4D
MMRAIPRPSLVLMLAASLMAGAPVPCMAQSRPHRGGNGPHTVSSMLGQPQYCDVAPAN